MNRAQSGPIAEAENIMLRLEEAIALGNHREAARLAKEVSKMHITAKLTNQVGGSMLQTHLNL